MWTEMWTDMWTEMWTEMVDRNFYEGILFIFDVMDRNFWDRFWDTFWDSFWDTFWDTLLDIFWDTFWNISWTQTMQYLQQTPIDTPDVTKSLSPASPMITKAPHQHPQCYQKLFVGTPTGDKSYPSAPPKLFSIKPAR